MFEEGITIMANLGTEGFKKGTKEIESAVKKMSASVNRMSRQMTNGMKRFVTSLIGAGSVFSIISKGVSAFMSENEALSQRMSAIWTAVGNLLGPIITQIIDWVSTAVSYFLGFLKLLGVTGKSASELSTKATKATKELQRTLAGFDELNVLQDNSSSGGSGDKQNPLKDLEPTEWMKRLAELLKNKMWDQAADMIVDKINEIIYKIRDKAYEAGQQIGEYLGGIIHIAARIIKDVDWHALGETIANFFNGLLQKIDGKDLGTIIVGKFVIAIGMLTGFLENLDWEQTAQFISDAVVGIFESLGDAIAKADFKKIGEGIRKFFEKLRDNQEETTQAFYSFLKSAWEAATDLLRGLLGSSDGQSPLVNAFESIGESLGKFFKSFPENMPNLSDNLSNLWKILEKIIGWTGEFVIPTALETLSSVLGALDSVLAAVLPGLVSFVDNFLIPFAALNVGAVSGSIEILAFSLDQLFKTISGKQSFGEMMDNLWYHGREDMRAFDEAIDSIENSRNTILNVSSDFASAAVQIDMFGQGSVEAAADAAQFEASLDALQTELLGYAEGIDDSGAATEFLKSSIGNLKDGYQDLAVAMMENGNGTSANIEMQEKLQAIVAQYVTLLKEEGSTLEENGAVVKDIADATTANAEAVTDMAAAQKEAATAVQEANASIQEVPSTTDEAGEGYSTFGEKAGETSEETQVTTSEMVQILKADWDELGASITQKATELKDNVTREMEGMKTNVGSIFGQLATNATVWGSDLMIEFINGINARMPELINTLVGVAQTVDSYIGFSLPDKGPLSDFDKSGPDMVDLFAEGMEGKTGRLTEALNAIAETVSFRTPGIAGGAILPYGVAAASGGSGGIDSSGALDLLEQIRAELHDTRNELNNMQFVAQFGNLRALAREITREQKQLNRAEGN